MKIELLMLAWSAALCVVLIVPAALGHLRQVGVPALAGNRENTPAATGWAGRAKRAHTNMLENLPPFAALVLVVVVAGKTSATTTMAAELFLIGRVVHAVAYIAGIAPVRTLGFFVGVIAMAMLLVAAVT